MSDMNREKRAEIIQDALEYLDDDMIENVDKLRMGTKVPVERTGKFKNFFAHSTRYLAVAASVCLLIMGAFAWENVMGPSNSMKAPMGTESGGDKDRVPNAAPEISDDYEDGTEVKPEKPGEESDAVFNGTELDTDVVSSQEKNTEEKPNPPEAVEPGEPDHYSPMGDAYQLVDNYVKVAILPNKEWASEESIKDNYAKSIEIGEWYYGSMDKFIEALCDTPRHRTDMVMDTGKPVEDFDVYHIFFQRTDGEIVQVCIFADYGFVYFYGDSEYGMKIKGGLLSEVLTVIWTHM
ncbi:MAG: hypothetical protein J6B96_05650 [Agathobacter sp.]|nr:hypothetical protein [Agathobacter sp.]